MNSKDDSASSPKEHPRDEHSIQSGDDGSPNSAKDLSKSSWFRRSFNPFRIATLRGLAVVLPPLLTVIFFVWAWNAIDRAILRPVESASQRALVWTIEDSMDDVAARKLAQVPDNGFRFEQIEGRTVLMAEDGHTYGKIQNNWIPLEVINTVDAKPGEIQPTSSYEYYLRFVQIRYLKRHLVIPAFLALFLAIMYLVGKLLAAGIGRIFYHFAEALINRLPIIRNVYSSVKQVTDFVFSDNDVQFNRVVAVEYPRKGIWSIGFVTGDSMIDIRNAAGEPMISVLMPTSPMPATGFTISVPKSETIDLNLTMDQAIQFCVSCGVVVPNHQMSKAALDGISKRIETKIENSQSEDGSQADSS